MGSPSEVADVDELSSGAVTPEDLMLAPDVSGVELYEEVSISVCADVELYEEVSVSICADLELYEDVFIPVCADVELYEDVSIPVWLAVVVETIFVKVIAIAPLEVTCG